MKKIVSLVLALLMMLALCWQWGLVLLRKRRWMRRERAEPIR